MARQQPDYAKVTKLKNFLTNKATGLGIFEQLNWFFGNIITWEQGYNTATLALVFFENETETLEDGRQYPTLWACYKMRGLMTRFHNWCGKQKNNINLAVYSKRQNKENRYFMMRTEEDFSWTKKMQDSIILALRRISKQFDKIIAAPNELLEKENAQEIAKIKYKKMLYDRALKAMKKAQSIDTSEGVEENDDNKDTE